MTAEMIEKMQKVDRPPRYNHFLPNRSASRPANRSPLLVSHLLVKVPYNTERIHVIDENRKAKGRRRMAWGCASEKREEGLTSHKPANKLIRPIEPTTPRLEDCGRYQGS